MKVDKKSLEKSQIELIVELSVDEFKPYLEKGALEVSKRVKIEGFRQGKVPYPILKQKVGEMTIMEEAARIAINKTIDKAIEDITKEGKQPIGKPMVDIVKLAPENPVQYKVVLSILPGIELGKYKDLKIKQEKVEVKKEDVEKTLKHLQETGAQEKITDKEAKDGDKVMADINMSMDKVPLEGGQSKDVVIILGKEYFVPGFDKKIIGSKKGDKKEFSLPYPKDYHQANLAGKLVDFKVEIKEVYERQLPKLDDDFAKKFGLKKIDELEKNISKNIEEEKKHKANHKIEIDIVEKIMKDTKFDDIAEVLVNQEVQTMMGELENQVNSQGGKFEDYLASIKKTRNQLTLDLLPDALKRVKSALLIREIAIKEDIKVDEKKIDKRVEELLKQYKGYEKVEERVKEPSYRMYLNNVMTNQKTMEKLKQWNLEK